MTPTAFHSHPRDPTHVSHVHAVMALQPIENVRVSFSKCNTAMMLFISCWEAGVEERYIPFPTPRPCNALIFSRPLIRVGVKVSAMMSRRDEERPLVGTSGSYHKYSSIVILS